LKEDDEKIETEQLDLGWNISNADEVKHHCPPFRRPFRRMGPQATSIENEHHGEPEP
jgi:hypothetical protein